MAPGCARRKYPKEEGLTFFRTNAREFMETDPGSAFSAPGTARRHGLSVSDQVSGGVVTAVSLRFGERT